MLAADGAGLGRNPAWENDELSLALDLYLRRGQPSISDPEVIALSDLLNRLPIHPVRPDASRFRNQNGVHMKLANFMARDPGYPGKGLTGGGDGVDLIWNAFASDPDGLAAAVARIRAVGDGRVAVPAPGDGEAEAIEGRILYREHRVRERDPSLVRKKAAVLRRMGRLACEVCDLDFRERYGELGQASSSVTTPSR